MNNFHWRYGNLNDYSAIEAYAIFRLRQAVFIIEQQCIYPDIDDIDYECQHLSAWQEDVLIGVARIIAPKNSASTDAQDFCMIGRLTVDQRFRGKKLGEKIMRRAIQMCHQHYPGYAIEISAQQRLQHFYESLGFQAISSMYLEDDIPHIRMRLS